MSGEGSGEGSAGDTPERGLGEERRRSRWGMARRPGLSTLTFGENLFAVTRGAGPGDQGLATISHREGTMCDYLLRVQLVSFTQIVFL